ncbi:nucleotidyltransferase domain-containing protein [Robertmurraya kyonggiensis]|uniref:Polymerase nucleotidyl transferase domain-containing protein n=1 Tax=Robertmurraya kyonggiensis TaxID=1037680 RepID=A0A4U1D2Y2_9BACI|nr:nucleotidyltransferase domain-containing protein [Robertmurraya kyonggiensis]TKC16749.1 hypothetical protein FA727_11810 [Robertmurraya kyonggiensis]
MSDWKVALEEFLKDWKDRDDVVGALVCGSYVTGNPSKRSDIDVHLILSEDADWRERGNQVVQGFLIEYFVNPPRQIREYFEDDFYSRRTMSMVQFMTGQTLFDKTGIIQELKDEAQEWINKEYGELNTTLLEMKKYAIWDALDNLKDCFEQERLDFQFVYYNSLAKLFSEYSQFLGLEAISFYQINSYLTDPTYLKKYLKKEFPDAEFKVGYVKALAEIDKQNMMKAYGVLVEHVLAKMGGFQIDGWKLRSSVDA